MSAKAYVVVHLTVTDFDRYFAEYVPGVVGVIAKHGGTLLVATNEPENVEGTMAGNWHVIVEFPTMDSAKAWYADPEYQPLLALRENELTDGGSLSFVSAFAPPA